MGLALPLGLAACRAGPDLSVFAAASTQDALREVVRDLAASNGPHASIVLGGSSALAQQIRNGAPADVFISANPDWMDALEREDLVQPGTRFDLLSNSLVLIASGKGVPPVAIDPQLDLAAMLGRGRIAMAFVEAAPAGIYGAAALRSLGLWGSIAGRVAQTENVRGALALVATGQAPLGIVYATDADADDNVSVLGTFPAHSHPPIRYPAAALTASRHPGNARFLQHLRGPSARVAFERHGFKYIAGR